MSGYMTIARKVNEQLSRLPSEDRLPTLIEVMRRLGYSADEIKSIIRDALPPPPGAAS